MIPAPPLHVGASVSRRPELLVEDVVGELDRMKGVLAPVTLGVLLRMGVLDGEAIRARGVERCTIRVAQVRGEVRFRPRVGTDVAGAVHEIDGIVLQVVNAHPAALVRIRHRAPMLEAPLPCCGDGAVDATRTRGRRGHDAWIVRIERVRNLHHHGDVDAPCAVVVVCQRLLARDLAGVQGRRSIRVDVRAIQRAISAVDRGIHERSVVRVDRTRPQFRRSRICRIRESGRRRAGEAGRAEAAGQQVVAAAIVHGSDDGTARDERRQSVAVGA